MKDRRNYPGRPIEPEIVEEPGEKKNLTGHISGCELLNVRRDPDPSSPVVTVLNTSAMVMVHEKGSTPEFYKVTTTEGVSGYCMKKFIEFNR